MNPEPLLEQVKPLLPQWLHKQRWFSSDEAVPRSVSFLTAECKTEQSPHLVTTLVRLDDGATYQVPLGVHVRGEEKGTLLGHENALLASVTVDGTDYVVYDALVDSTLCLALFEQLDTGDEYGVSTARPIGAEQSNTSIIYDNKIIVKYFRRLAAGANPDLEVTTKLSEAGFPHVAEVLLSSRTDDGYDLAVAQPFLFDGSEGWQLALASVRDYLGRATQGGSTTAGAPGVRYDATDPSLAGGDFADEAARLGEMTAELHVALAQAFPTEELDIDLVADSLANTTETLTDDQRASLDDLVARLRELQPGEGGFATRIHGDYHLGQTLRAVSGWYVFDFEGEPARPLHERTRPASPFKDLTGMLRSFHYAAATGLFEQVPVERDSMQVKAMAWEKRNRDAFTAGYMSVAGIDKYLPSSPQARELLMSAYEIEKALYELAYERAYRPEWTPIPEVAIARLLN